MENPKNLDIVEMEAAMIPNVLDDVAMAVINGNYAISSGLKMADALAAESAESESAQTYVNVLVVKAGNEQNAAVQALVKVLGSDAIRTYINETYDGAVIPMF